MFSIKNRNVTVFPSQLLVYLMCKVDSWIPVSAEVHDENEKNYVFSVLIYSKMY